MARLSSAVGVAWIYARELEPMETEGGGDGDGAAPKVRASSLVDFQAALLGLAVLRSPAVVAAGRPQLGALLDPLPSLRHSRLPIAAWVRFRGALLTTTLSRLLDAIAAADAPPADATLGAVSRLGKQALTLLAWLAHSRLPHALVEPGASPPLDHLPLLSLLLAAVDRAGGKKEGASSRATAAAAAGAAAGAAAVSQLVSWGRKAVAASGGEVGKTARRVAERVADRAGKTGHELQESALRLLLLRLADASAEELPLLGEVSMVITALAAGDGDAERSEPLAAHREAVAALCWRLFQLLSHDAADVRAGAAQRWAALAARHPSLHRDAFGDSALGAEAPTLAGGASWRPPSPHGSPTHVTS